MTDVKKVSVVESFSKFHVTLKEAWLNEVLEYLQVERADADIPTVIQLVYEQWLFSELSNSTRPKIRLPPFEKKASLDSNVVVQINWVIDIHTSMYAKLNQHAGRTTDHTSLHSEPSDGTEDLDSASRMYLMEVTDGQRKLRAIEYQKIDDLCGKLSHGTKLLICGGTICRRNVLLLTPNNVVVLGGESEICQQNGPIFIVAQRLGIDEKKLIKCARINEFENSLEAVEGIEMEETAEKVSITVPPVLMRENIATTLGEQQSKNRHSSKSLKGENGREKKQKRPVLSRTITSYFQPQRKTLTSELSSKISTKSQIALVDQGIKEEPEPEYVPQDSCQKGKGKMDGPPPLLPPTADLKKQSQHATTVSAFPRESNRPSEQSGQSAVPLQVHCSQRIMEDWRVQSELREVPGKSITTPLRCQSPDAQNFCSSSHIGIEPEKTSPSARLWGRNLERTRLQVVEDSSTSTSTRKNQAKHSTVVLSGESERKESTVKPLIPIRSLDTQGNCVDVNQRSTIIPSSNIQEQTIWNANKWRHATSENSKQFLANEFLAPSPPSKVQMQIIDNESVLPVESSPSIRSRTSLPQNSPTNQPLFNDVHKERAASVSSVPFQTDVASRRLDTQFSTSEQNNCRLTVVSPHDNPVQFHSSQRSFTNSELQKITGHSMCRKTSFKNHATTLVLPDATLQIVPHVNVVELYRALNIVSIREACHQRRYCLVSHRKRVQPIFCKLRAGLQFIGQSWTAALRIADETCDALDCLVDNTAICNLIGFTPQEAQQAATMNDRVRVAYYKGRAQAVLETFRRLDLVLTIEFSSSSSVLPLIVDITNLSTALGLC